MATLRQLEFTGLRELNTYLKKIGVPDAAVKQAHADAGALVQREAWRLMPVDSGNMARTLKVSKSKSYVQIQVGNNTTVRYARNFHAVKLGISKGGFHFVVRAHTRAGRPVRGYTANRRIPNNPFLITAYERKKEDLIRAYVDAVGNLIKQANPT